jgi:NADP-dependent 3-hydroxy acid dehydrogenase YdfG
MKNSVALITGTSSGFGKLIALTLAAKGIKVFAGMRNSTTSNAVIANELNAVENITVVELDVAKKASIQNAVKSIVQETGRIDILVNNAGVIGMGVIEQFSDKEIKNLFETNFFGLLNVTKSVLPTMRKNKNGLVINMSSGLGRMTMPFNGIYSASKYAVEAVSQALRYELSMVGLDLVVIEPGAFPSTNATNSGFHHNASDKKTAREYGDLAANFPSMIATMFQQMVDNGYAPNPQIIADKVLEIIEMPTEKRPFRIVADPQSNGKMEQLNAFNDEMQQDMLRGMHMTFLDKSMVA